MTRCLMILALLFSSGLQAALQEKTVSYSAGDTTMTGYLVWDDTKGVKQPGVLVVHEWWGLNEYARQRARMLAAMGYTALAVDMYGEGKTSEHAAEATALMNSVVERAGVSQLRFTAALAFLKKQASVEPSKIAAIGYCFGGSTVLNMARLGTDLTAVASFHGILATQTPARPGQVKARILVFNGAADEFVSADSISAFEKEMTQAGVDYRFVNYPGVRHGFSNPDADRLGKVNNLPIAYDAEADKRSWETMQQWFSQLFNP